MRAPAALAFALLSLPASAEELMRLAVQSGSWGLMVHQVSMTSLPDTCIAMNPSSGFAIRHGGGATQIRMINHDWSLPAGITGTITIKVGEFTLAVDVNDNTDTMVNAELESPEELLDAMDKASIMTVAVGRATATTVSLVGSTRVTNAFRTCAGMRGNAPGGGSNPFG